MDDTCEITANNSITDELPKFDDNYIQNVIKGTKEIPAAKDLNLDQRSLDDVKQLHEDLSQALKTIGEKEKELEKKTVFKFMNSLGLGNLAKKIFIGESFIEKNPKAYALLSNLEYYINNEVAKQQEAEQEREATRQNDAATTIQSAVRGHVARAEVAAKQEAEQEREATRQNDAATTIQRAFRDSKAKAELLRSINTALIQLAQRGTRYDNMHEAMLKNLQKVSGMQDLKTKVENNQKSLHEKSQYINDTIHAESLNIAESLDELAAKLRNKNSGLIEGIRARTSGEETQARRDARQEFREKFRNTLMAPNSSYEDKMNILKYIRYDLVDFLSTVEDKGNQRKKNLPKSKYEKMDNIDLLSKLANHSELNKGDNFRNIVGGFRASLALQNKGTKIAPKITDSNKLVA